jgi:hypothetical protein
VRGSDGAPSTWAGGPDSSTTPSLAPTAWTTSMSYPVSLPSLPWKLNGL